MPMRKSIVRTLSVGALAVVAVAGSAWFAMGDLRAVPASTAGAAAQEAGTTLKPSYLVSVRPPTPEEQAQRDALARPKPVQPLIDLTPRAEVAEPPVQTGPKARLLTAVNVRSGPSTSTATVTVASAGSELPVLGQEGSWTQVALPEGGNGWIASKFLAQ